MRNSAAIRVKVKANYICAECGSTELIQAHHERPGDDSSMVPLCAECHSKKHPELPKTLFFNKTQQPYWFNKSAGSIAKELGVHSRTVIRASKRLGILKGELSTEDENLIKANIPKLRWGERKIVKPLKLKPIIPPRIEFKVEGIVIEDGRAVAIAGEYLTK